MRKRYNISIFSQNIDKLSEEIENKAKNKEIGKVISSLQAPFKNLMTMVSTKREEYENIMRRIKR